VALCFKILREANVPRPDPLSDLHLQLEVKEDSMSLTGWAEGQVKPKEPQLTADISELATYSATR